MKKSDSTIEKFENVFLCSVFLDLKIPCQNCSLVSRNRPVSIRVSWVCFGFEWEKGVVSTSLIKIISNFFGYPRFSCRCAGGFAQNVMVCKKSPKIFVSML